MKIGVTNAVTGNTTLQMTPREYDRSGLTADDLEVLESAAAFTQSSLKLSQFLFSSSKHRALFHLCQAPLVFASYTGCRRNALSLTKEQKVFLFT